MVNKYLEILNLLPDLSQVEYRRQALSFFCGGGGLDLGMALAGFRVGFASDVEKTLCDTIEHNFNDCYVSAADISDLNFDIIADKTGVRDVDLIVGGPPCQSFSILGQRRSFDDPRGQLVFEFIRIINEVQPRAFLFENVPGLKTLNGGEDWNTLLSTFSEELGYKMFTDVLNSADYGIPQIRKRVFIIGFRDHNTQFNFPIPTHKDPALGALAVEGRENWLPAKFALEKINGAPNHEKRKHGDRVRLRYEKIEPGKRDKVDHTDRIHPDRPSGTVLVGSRSGGGRPFIHPYEPRHITVREAARLQSFPDWYEFKSTGTWQYRAVGNAVPPVVAYNIGLSISEALDR